MNRRIFMWLASLGPALLSARKSFARTGRYAHVTDEMILRNEKLITTSAREGSSKKELIKEWFGGSVKLYRCYVGGYVDGSVEVLAAPHLFEIRIDVDAVLSEVTFTDIPFCKPFIVDVEINCNFGRLELIPHISGDWDKVDSWEGTNVNKQMLEKLVEYDDGTVCLYGDGFMSQRMRIGIKPSKLMQVRKKKTDEKAEYLGADAEEWTREYRCFFYYNDLSNANPKEREGSFTRLPLTPEERRRINESILKSMRGEIPPPDPRMVKLSREDYDRGDYMTGEELLNDIRRRMGK